MADVDTAGDKLDYKPKMQCGNCAYFYRAKSEQESDLCRRNPPVVVLHDGMVRAIQSPVEPTSWCGEWRPHPSHPLASKLNG